MKFTLYSMCIVMLLSLSGCGGSSEEEAIRWMADERNQTQPLVPPIPEPKQFVPKSYDNAAATEPFSNQKLTQALKRESNQSSNSDLVAPELARRKEPLESNTLDSMVMVGSIIKNGQPVALLKIDSLLYQVRQGNYLGQNFGRVTKITEGEITLREIIQDSDGEWIERTASLQLQEVTK